MKLALSARTTPVILAVVLLGATALVAANPTSTPPTSAALRIWSDLVRDADQVPLALTRISLADEAEIGRRMVATAGFSYERSPLTAAYVTSVGQSLVAALGSGTGPFEFKVVRNSTPNAFALPGGHVFITTGLLDLLASEAELAVILGHEISHVSLGHTTRRLQYEVTAERILGSDAASIVGLVYHLVTASYDPEEETDADLNGVRLAASAGYDPAAAIAAFGILAQLEGGDTHPERSMAGELAGSLAAATNLFRSHPAAGQRLLDVRQLLQQQSAAWTGRRFYVGKANYANRISVGADDRPAEWTTFQPPS